MRQPVEEIGKLKTFTLYLKNPKIWDTEKSAVIILKFQQGDSVIEYCVQKVQMEWQTV